MLLDTFIQRYDEILCSYPINELKPTAFPQEGIPDGFDIL